MALIDTELLDAEHPFRIDGPSSRLRVHDNVHGRVHVQVHVNVNVV